MFIGPLPRSLQDIRDDGRSTGRIIAALERRDVAVFQKRLYLEAAEPAPSFGTMYNFLGVRSEDLANKTAEKIFATVARECPGIRKPTLRSILLLQERMTRKRLYADIVAMNEPVLNPDSGDLVLIGLGREDDEGQSWIAAIDANKHPAANEKIMLFLAPSSEC